MEKNQSRRGSGMTVQSTADGDAVCNLNVDIDRTLGEECFWLLEWGEKGAA